MKSEHIYNRLREHGVRSVNAHSQDDGGWHVAFLLTDEARERLGVEGPLWARCTGPDETPEDLCSFMLPYVVGEKALPETWAPRRALAETQRRHKILLTCMRELLKHVDREASNGDDIPDFMWECWNAARRLVAEQGDASAGPDWDPIAANAWLKRNSQDADS